MSPPGWVLRAQRDVWHNPSAILFQVEGLDLLMLLVDAWFDDGTSLKLDQAHQSATARTVVFLETPDLIEHREPLHAQITCVRPEMPRCEDGW